MDNEIPAILAVDDNPANLNLLFDLLDDANFEVLISQNGESALKRAKNTHPDIILLDVMMPGIDGFETCRQLKADEGTRDIPIIFMTALTSTDDKVKGFELGAVDYITKPIQPEEVLARVRTHLTIQRLQQDLQIKNEELHKSLEREKELSELKSRFISMVSHEFRTPLATILTSSNLLKRYEKQLSNSKKLTHLERIEGAVKRMTGMLNKVLTISKTDAGKEVYKPESLYIIEFCRNLVDDCRLISEATHTITFACPDEDFQVMVDPNLLHHILSNLLSNAVKYSPNSDCVHFDFVYTDQYLIFTIKDQGIGIAEEDQKHLFEEFHRGVNVQTIQGTGLGLSIVKRFVKLHGGTIEVASEFNQGTTCTVSIPLVHPQTT